MCRPGECVPEGDNGGRDTNRASRGFMCFRLVNFKWGKDEGCAGSFLTGGRGGGREELRRY